MRYIFRSVMVGLLASSFVSSSFASKLNAVPQAQPPAGYVARERTGAVAPLAVGSPRAFAMGDAWLTSDYEDCWDCTDIDWYDTESLQVFGAFYSASAKNTTTIVDIVDQTGTNVFHSSYAEPALAGVINQYTTDIGVLGAGDYKLSIKFKQGRRVIGQKFWFTVLVDLPPATPQP